MLEALRLSLVCSLGALAVSVVLGVPLAFLLARVAFPGRNLVRALSTLPMVLPPVVGGVALLLAFGRRGLVGQWLDQWFGITLPFTTAGAILAETFVAMPFLVITVEAGLRAMDRRYEDAAATLGAGRWTDLPAGHPAPDRPGAGGRDGPVLGPGAGRVRGHHHLRRQPPRRTQTMPLAVYLALETDLEAAIALSLVLLAVSWPCWSPSVTAGSRPHEPGGQGPRGIGGEPGAARPRQLHLDVDLAVATGELVVLLGPNGAGKTTLLRALAGLLALDRGRVVLDGQVLEDAEAGAWVPTERRPVGFVFQDYLLFPHLSALENVAFGLRARGVGRAEARRRAAAWLDRVGLAGQATGPAPGPVRRPGPAGRPGPGAGRATRGCCCWTSPWPPSTRAPAPRSAATCAATWPPSTAPGCSSPTTRWRPMALADRLVVLEDGRVAQTGSPAEVSARPRSRYVAELVGVNLFRAVPPAAVELGGGAVLVTAGDHDGEVYAAVHPPRRRPAPPPSRGHPPQRLGRHRRYPGRGRRPGPGPRGRPGPDRGRGHPGRRQRAPPGRRRPGVGQRQGHRGHRLPRLTEPRRPPMAPTAGPPPDRIELRPIGHVRTAYRRLEDTPIQTTRNPGEPGRLVLLEEYAGGLEGLEGFDYAHLICFLDRAWQADGRGAPFTGDRLRPVPFLLQHLGQRVGGVRHPRPVRPNYLALSLVGSWPCTATWSTSPGSTCSTAPRCSTSSRSSPTWTCPATPPAPWLDQIRGGWYQQHDVAADPLWSAPPPGPPQRRPRPAGRWRLARSPRGHDPPTRTAPVTRSTVKPASPRWMNRASGTQAGPWPGVP